MVRPGHTEETGRGGPDAAPTSGRRGAAPATVKPAAHCPAGLLLFATGIFFDGAAQPAKMQLSRRWRHIALANDDAELAAGHGGI